MSGRDDNGDIPSPSFLELPWGRMAWGRRNGRGVPMLFLSGTACDAEDHAELFRALPEDMPYIWADFRAHGASDAPTDELSVDSLTRDVTALLDALALNRIVLAGHSLGGMAATAASRDDPRVRGLVLFEGWTGGDAYGAFADGHTYGSLDADAVARIEEKLRRTKARVSDELWRELAETTPMWDGYETLARAPFPVLEIYGDAGYTDKTPAALRIPENPRIRTVWISGAGHYLPHERPVELADLCARFRREHGFDRP